MEQSTPKIQEGLELIEEAVAIRAEITERYRLYGLLSKAVQVTAMIEHSDFKNAVDALYYLGGGWPTENSKGRMERLLDNFAGMYRVLTLIGSGHLVEEHLAKKGIKVTLENPIKDFQLSAADVRLLYDEYELKQFPELPEPTTLKELVSSCVAEAQELQRFICQNADVIKKGLKPGAKLSLQVEDEEYDRLFMLTKFMSGEKADTIVKKKNKINLSVQHFKLAATHR